MKFFFFHLMPWPYLPADYDGPAWITCPNALYDPERGTEVYNRYIDEMCYAETLGFDGVVMNEHHANAYGNMPSPNLIGAILARQTSKVKIAIVGNALPLYDPPTRVAEEFAMIDVISGGRLIAGMVVGGGPEYYANGLNPTYAREKFYEAHDLVIQAWTRPGPFEFHGKHYQLRYVNPWPRPVQQPHPTVWIPGTGSIETLEFCAKHRYAFMGIPYFHRRVFERNFDAMREICAKEGYTPDPEQLGWLTPVYVADTDAQAWAEYESHLFYFIDRLLKGVLVFPPGYTTARSLVRMSQVRNDFIMTCRTRQDIEAGDFAIVGSAATVREKMAERIERYGAGNILSLLHLGTLPADLTRRNMELYATEVVPFLRRRFDGKAAAAA
ncbi:MAG: LLM class flavin-dependent oxidoreductase [Candidatus Binatia bacterium]